MSPLRRKEKSESQRVPAAMRNWFVVISRRIWQTIRPAFVLADLGLVALAALFGVAMPTPGQRFAVFFGNMPAVLTLPRGIPRIDVVDRHLRSDRFVDQEALELEKAPVRVPCPLRALHRYPAANARQLLQGNPTAGVLRRLHDPLTAAAGLGPRCRDCRRCDARGAARGGRGVSGVAPSG